MRTRHRHTGTGRGFTLVELLVVIALIGILATLVVSVGSAVRSKAAENETRAMLKVVQGAIDSFRDAQRNRPPGMIVDWRDPGNAAYLSVEAQQMNAAKANSWRLYEQLRMIQDAKTRIAALSDKFMPTEQIERDPINNPGTVLMSTFFADSFGNPVNYQIAGGAGGTPVLVSSGGNGIWGDGDDVRSDDQ